MLCRILLIGLLAVTFYGEVHAQELIPGQDSIKTTQDSLTYRAIEEYSQKAKFTRFLHHILFKSSGQEPDWQLKRGKIIKSKSYSRSEGKTIRNINILSYDPFGYNIRDTSMLPSGLLMKTGNSLHIKTRPVTIKNLLLFKENEPFDSLLVKESERLIRSQKYIQDLLLYTLPTSPKADSVDIYIQVWDVWSIVPAFKLSESSGKLGLSDINFVGLGNRLEGNVEWNQRGDANISRISYLIPNIRNSFISVNIQYKFSGHNDLIGGFEFPRPFYSASGSNHQYLFSGNRNLIKSIELERPFYSPVARWAGGIFLGQMVTAQSYVQHDSLRYLSSLTNIQDFWAANAWHIYKGHRADDRITSLVLSARMLRTRYPGRPAESEAEHVFNNQNIYFAGIGIASRKYIRDRYIFNFGKVEDVPVGRTFGLTAGFDVQRTNLWYLGLKAAWGNYYSFGYLSAHAEYGTFIGSNGLQQEVISGRINYYTRLLNLGSWKIRQFVKPTLTYGINRLPTDNLTFGSELKGFEGLTYSATRMMVLTLQTQSYAPWKFIGFRFGPYVFSSYGILGNAVSGVRNSKLHTLFGLGMLIKNDYLMFSTFQLSLSFYPFVPGEGHNVFRTNAWETSDYGFRDFEISKPGVVDYR